MRYVETIGKALMLGVDVVDLDFPHFSSVSDLQRICEHHLSIAHFHKTGVATDHIDDYLWNDFSDIEKLRQSLFPDEQRRNPWELWELSRTFEEARRFGEAYEPVKFSRYNLAGNEYLDIRFAMQDIGGGWRGTSLSSCEFSISSLDREDINGHGIGGSLKYLPNGTLDGDKHFTVMRMARLYDPWTKLKDVSLNATGRKSFKDWLDMLEKDITRLLGESTLRSCWLTSPTAHITNVSEYINLRRQPEFSARVIRQVPLGERVRPLRFDNLSVIGQERDRQSCINACQAFGANREDAAARDRVQQCIDDNMLWYEITDARGNRGWVSRKFLEEAE